MTDQGRTKWKHVSQNLDQHAHKLSPLVPPASEIKRVEPDSGPHSGVSSGPSRSGGRSRHGAQITNLAHGRTDDRRSEHSLGLRVSNHQMVTTPRDEMARTVTVFACRTYAANDAGHSKKHTVASTFHLIASAFRSQPNARLLGV